MNQDDETLDKVALYCNKAFPGSVVIVILAKDREPSGHAFKMRANTTRDGAMHVIRGILEAPDTNDEKMYYRAASEPLDHGSK